MKTIREISAMRDAVTGWRQDGESVALVPTMGNLHRGHMSLIALAHEHAERVVVSLFVNPAQFGPDEDFDGYPRSLDLDRRRLSRAGVDVLFAPDSAAIYPFGEASMTRVSVPELSGILCGAARPGHFDGVTSVVCRLFNLIQPNVAVFGQKDYQQLVIIRRMVADLHIPVQVIAGRTQREKDGLALSSRNQYLTDAERQRAPELHRALDRCRKLLADGARDFEGLEAKGRRAMQTAGFAPDYFVIRRAGDLGRPEAADHRRLVVMAAGTLGRARLIDNLLVKL
jgi:pantoate--beta-alanine ligase